MDGEREREREREPTCGQECPSVHVPGRGGGGKKGREGEEGRKMFYSKEVVIYTQVFLLPAVWLSMQWHPGISG